MSDLPKISYSDGGVHVTVDLRALDQRMREAQRNSSSVPCTASRSIVW